MAVDTIATAQGRIISWLLWLAMGMELFQELAGEWGEPDPRRSVGEVKSDFDAHGSHWVIREGFVSEDSPPPPWPTHPARWTRDASFWRDVAAQAVASLVAAVIIFVSAKIAGFFSGLTWQDVGTLVATIVAAATALARYAQYRSDKFFGRMSPSSGMAIHMRKRMAKQRRRELLQRIGMGITRLTY